MRVDPASHLITGVHYVPSPNADERPEGCQPSVIVLHNISLPPGEFGGPGIEQLFTNRLDPDTHPDFASIAEHRVSAHVLVRRDGSTVQFVPFHRRAWHAGISSYQGRENCNDFSIGIELEGTDTLPYENAQYLVLATLIDALRIAYPSLSRQRIVGHSEIAPDRKTDPGQAFDWNRLHQELA
ncbi:MAG: 1,6-anhydro-N-acetylmuramyl-L-alanine amidase AmpD [Gammaproteobacteria bacterium]|nr:1,6-anhydro-N-acetylmuramyl-L-alanine amidase AmpD [Gammaproteobacteria bacterium]